MRNGWLWLGTGCLAVLLCGCATTGSLAGTPKSPFVGEWVSESVPKEVSEEFKIQSVTVFIAADGNLTFSASGKDGAPVLGAAGTWETKGEQTIGFIMDIEKDKVPGTAQLVSPGRALVAVSTGSQPLAIFFRKK